MSKNHQNLISQFKSYLSVQKQRSINTTNSYISDIDQFFSITNVKNIDIIEKIHIDLYIQALHQLNLTTRTINRKISAMENFFNYLVSNHLISLNPFKSIRRPR